MPGVFAMTGHGFANLAVWELERYYGIDLAVTRPAVLKYLDNVGRPDPPTLLFLRGFRSSKRLWIENAFTFDRTEVIPFPKEPPRLSIEAAWIETLPIGNGSQDVAAFVAQVFADNGTDALCTEAARLGLSMAEIKRVLVAGEESWGEANTLMNQLSLARRDLRKVN
jgi:hypothetical protein